MNYTKERCNGKEIAIYLLASESDIAPHVVSFTPNSITSLKFTPLIDIIYNISIEERKYYADSIISNLNKLHELGIFWMDPSEENVVIDLENKKSYLIDFGRSQFIDDLIFESVDMINLCKQMEVDEVLFFCKLGGKPNEIGIHDKVVSIEYVY